MALLVLECRLVAEARGPTSAIVQRQREEAGELNEGQEENDQNPAIKGGLVDLRVPGEVRGADA